MKIIYVFFCSVLIFCCKINQNFKNDFSKDDDTLSFSLRSPDYKQCPVICIHDSGKDFYFKVDTGTTNSYFYLNGLKKTELKIKEGYTFKDVTVNFQFEDPRLLIDGKSHNVSLYIKEENSCTDGLLGIDFLSQYDNIVFDYKNKTMKLNQLPINSTPIPMYKKYKNHCYVYYSVDGVLDFGLIDTGAQVFVIREDYKNNYTDISEEEINKLRAGPDIQLKKMNPIFFNEIILGNITYKNIPGRLAIDKHVIVAQKDRKELRKRSTLGTPFFKNHIIQLDLKNNLFYIE